MKNFYRYMSAVFAIVATASCSQEIEDPDTSFVQDVKLVPMTITVDGEMTKTAVAEDGKSIHWSEGDVVAVFDGTGKREFTVVDGSIDGKSATFTGLVDEGAAEFYAVYPYSAAVELADGRITASAPTQQLIENANVASGAILAVGKFAKGETVSFRNAVGFLRVDVTYDDVTEVIVTGKNVAGTAVFNSSAELEDVLSGEGNVVLTPSGDVFAKGSYYVTLLPGTTPADAFSITMVRAETGVTMTASKEITVPRNGGFFVEDARLTETFVIKDAATLQTFLASAKDYQAGQLATVVRDIDLKDVELSGAESFAGYLNGNGFSLKNWASSGVSLFDTVSGKVSGLRFDASCLLTPADAPGTFGFLARTVASGGIVDGCENNATVTFEATAYGAGAEQLTDAVYFGMLVGKNNGIVKNCVNNGALNIVSVPAGSDERGFTYIGGLVGLVDNEGDVPGLLNNVNNGDISYSITGRGGYLFMGGVAGGTTAEGLSSSSEVRTVVKECRNTGKIYHSFTQEIIGSGNAKSNYINMAGVIGYCEGNVIDCVNGVQDDASKGRIQLDAPTLETGEGYSAANVSVAGVSAFVLSTAQNSYNYGVIDVDGSFGPGYETYPGGGNKEDGGVFVAGVIGSVGMLGSAAQTDAISDCHNFGEMDINLPITSTSGTNYKSYHHVGGVVAYANATAANLSNNAKVSVYSEGTMNYLGGVIGQTDCNASNLINNGEILYTIGRVGGNQINNANQFFGGVLGYNTGDTMTSLTNNGCVTMVVNNTNQKLRVGGVAGSFGNATGVTNNADVTMTETVDHVKEIDFGGVSGASTSGSVTDVYNKGAVTYSGKKMTGTTYFAGIIGYSSSTAVENIYNEKPVSVTAEELGTSYIAGVMGSSSAKFTSVTNSNTVTVNSPITKTLYVSGVTGAARSATEYRMVKNESTISASSGTTLYLAGIAGHSAGNVKFYDCENNGMLDLNAPNLEAKDLYAGGICARPYSKSVYNNCTNAGDINVTAASASAACYLGGIAAQPSNATSAGNGYDVEKCTVTGDITVDCQATWYIGGAIAFGSQWSSTTSNHRIASGNTVECDITVSSSTIAHHVGGIIGYSGVHVDIENNSYAGKITVGSNDASKLSNVGGIVGTLAISQTSATSVMNAAYTLRGNVVGAEIVYDPTVGYGGMLVGAINNIATRTEYTNYSQLTLEYGGDKVKSGSKLNDTVVAAENYKDCLLSGYDYSGRYELAVSGVDSVIFE